MQKYANLLTFAWVLIGVQLGAWAKAPIRDHDIVMEDYFSLSNVGACKASPDGKQIVYAETRWEPPSEKRNTDLWVVSPGDKQVQRLTFDSASDSNPQWSPDGKYLYFQSGRTRAGEDDPPYNGKAQVWRLAMQSGKLTAVTRVTNGVGQYELSTDGAALYYTTTTEHVDEDWKELKTEYKKLDYGHGVHKFTQIWKLDLTSWRAKKLVDEKRVVVDFAIAPDQSRIAMLTRPDESMLTNEGWSRVDVYNVADKKVATLTKEGWRSDHPSPYGWLDSVSWSADSQVLAWTVSFDGYSPLVYIAEWNSQGPTIYELPVPKDVTIRGGTQHWRPRSRDLCFVGEKRARARLYCMEEVRGGRTAGVKSMTPEEGVVGAYSFDASGAHVAFVMGTTEHMPDVYWGGGLGTSQRVTNVNAQVDTWRLPKLSLVQWKGANGDEVEGILELPPDYKGDHPLPMVVEIHGGPTAASMFQLRFWIYGRTLLAAKGYAVLSPNYRGSTGYGNKFLVDLVGRENDIEVKDILRGVEAMVARGVADADRLGVMGWSNGGFLTNCLITSSDKFKAASSGAGVLDQVIQWGTEDTPGHVINYMNGLPWAKVEAYRKGSPMYRLGSVITPTLIHVGENDPRVPPAHSRTLFRALRHYLKVPTELVVYPGEGHGLTKYTHRKAKMAWDLAWFDRYLRPESESSADDAATN